MKCRHDLMGKIVTVSQIAERHKGGVKAQVRYRNIKSRAGWIVGERKMYLGTIHHGCVGDDEYAAEPGYLTVERVLTFYCVCFWPSMKPVLTAGFIEGGTPMSPSKYAWECLPEAQKKQVRDETRDDVAKHSARDALGRWK